MPTCRTVLAAPECIRTRRTGVAIDRLVLHAMDGTLPGTIAWFQRAGREVPTAAHYLIGRAGDVVQMVPDANKALHAGSSTEPGWNDRSIGIEHEVELTLGPRAHFPLGEWTDAMLDASARVAAALCRKFSLAVDRTHIVGHSDVPGHGSHIDPGPAFPWDRYLTLVRAHLAP